MANDETKELANLAEVFKALGHPTRLWIVKHLAGKELCVCDFVAGTNEEFSAISQHLNVLKKARVVKFEKRGKHIFAFHGLSIAWKSEMRFHNCLRTNRPMYLNSSARN